MSIAVEVDNLPECAWAGDDPRHPKAIYDFKTKYGPWATGCHKHFHEHRMFEELGTGKGQKLFTSDHAGTPRPRPVFLHRMIDEHGSITAALDAMGVDGINVISTADVPR